MTTALEPRKPELLPCAVCGHHESKLRYPVRDLIQARPGRWWFVTCTACGHGYLSPHPTDAELGELYRGLWSPEGLQLATNVGKSGFEKGLTRSRLAGLRQVLGGHPVHRLLDVGCGLGFFLRALADAWPDAEALGVELVDQAASRAERPGIEVLRRPWDQVELPSGEFDIVTLIHFLEHQRDPGVDVERAAALLRPGGALVVEVPQLDGWGRRIFGRWYWPHHRRRPFPGSRYSPCRSSPAGAWSDCSRIAASTWASSERARAIPCRPAPAWCSSLASPSAPRAPPGTSGSSGLP